MISQFVTAVPVDGKPTEKGLKEWDVLVFGVPTNRTLWAYHEVEAQKMAERYVANAIAKLIGSHEW